MSAKTDWTPKARKKLRIVRRSFMVGSGCWFEKEGVECHGNGRLTFYMAEKGGFGGGVTGFVVEDPLPVAVDILDHRRGLQ
jgi:hypothetical protein